MVDDPMDITHAVYVKKSTIGRAIAQRSWQS
jgi:hypothetical protein